MASGGELMRLGTPAALAVALGVNGINLAVVAAGNNSQANATLIVAGMNLVSTSGASTNSLALPTATGSGPIYIGVASAQTTVNLFPASGETFIDEGAQGAANAAVTIAASKNVMLIPHANTWFVVRGA